MGGGAGSSAFCLCTRSNLGPGKERDQATVARWPRSMPGHGAWLPPHVFAQHTRAGKAVETRPQFAHYGATSAPMLLAELTLRESEQEGVKGLSPLARLLRARHVPLDWAHRVGWDGNGGGAVAVASQSPLTPLTPPRPRTPRAWCPRPQLCASVPRCACPTTCAWPPTHHSSCCPPSMLPLPCAVSSLSTPSPPLLADASCGRCGGEHTPPFGHGSVSGHLS